MNISFRPLTEADLPQMHTWLNTPHVARFFKNQQTMQQIRDEYMGYITGEDPSDAYIILIDEVDVGYIQTYYYSDYADDTGYDELLEAEPYSAGVDLFIGNANYIYKGYGVRIMQRFIANYVFSKPKTTDIVITPEPANIAAINAYTKVGFEWYKTITTPGDGAEEYLMRLERKNFNV